MPKNYSSWSLLALKNELRKRKAKVCGKKATLVQRLLDYDKLYGGLVNTPDTSYKIIIPEPNSFLDINSDTFIPRITEQTIIQYSYLGQRENLVTSRNMYNEHYLKTCRIAHLGKEFFALGTCAAEMKKAVMYYVTVKFEEDTIIEAQCECAAGLGPYAQCKHVLVLMFGLENFCRTKEIKIMKTVTSQLQTFHQPRQLYHGVPVKAEALKLKESNNNYVNIRHFDPRPQTSSKEKYQECFSNMIINFKSTHLKLQPMPITQIKKPANKVALVHDHDYLQINDEDRFIKDQQLNLAQLDKLEEDTKNDKKKWSLERKKRLQSSNFGKICKCLHHRRHLLAKQLIKNQPLFCDAIKHGLKYEAVARAELEKYIGLAVRQCGIFVHPEVQYLASTPDGLVGSEYVVEIKCPFSAKDKYITPETIPYLELCEITGNFTLKKCSDYYYQVQGQMFCTGRLYCYFCIWTHRDFYIMKIGRDEEFIKKMTSKLKEFYEENFKNLYLCRYFYNIKF